MILWALASAALGGPDCVALDRSPAPLEGRAGDRKLALIVGVGDYLTTIGGESIDLEGPPQDALRIRELLVERYGFPLDNVCLLRDSEATRAQYIRGWREHLGRAESGDTVVYYFAGHGSQTTDFDGPEDETDGMDETILLHDSRAVEGVTDLLDDEFNILLGELYEKTENITVLVDACNSGTTTRSVSVGTSDFVERRVEPIERRRPPANGLDGAAEDYAPARLPGIVVVTAAQDGTSALERGGQGVFTNALLRSLDAKGEGSWEQLTQILPRWIAAQKSFQLATFEGRLDRVVFGSAVVDRGLSWQVVGVKGEDNKTITFRGPVMPGWTKGAILQVFTDGQRKRRARVRLTEANNLDATGKVLSGRSVSIGDYAVLESPGPDSSEIRVKIASNLEFAKDIRKAIKADTVLDRTVELVSSAADFVVRPVAGNRVEVVGAEGVRRNLLELRNRDDAENVAYTLGLHARQASILAMSGEPNEVYPHDMVEMRVVPIPDEPGCARTAYQPASRAVPYVQVPMCSPIQLELKLTQEPKRQLYISVLYLANDGHIEVWPRGATKEIFQRKGDTYVERLGWASPPLNAPDRIVVFGSHEDVDWKKLAQEALPEPKRSRGAATLQSFVDAQLSGTRGILDEAPNERGSTAWTSSFIQVQVIADSEKWSDSEQTSRSTCRRLRQSNCE